MTQRRASVVVARGYEPDSGHAVDAGEVARRFAAAVLARRSPGSRSDRNIPSRRCCVRFSYRMVPEVYQMFWAGMAAGEFINDAAIAAGSYRKQGTRRLAAEGGVRPRRGRGLKGRCLSLAQREEIALGRARGDSIRA